MTDCPGPPTPSAWGSGGQGQSHPTQGHPLPPRRCTATLLPHVRTGLQASHLGEGRGLGATRRAPAVRLARASLCESGQPQPSPAGSPGASSCLIQNHELPGERPASSLAPEGGHMGCPQLPPPVQLGQGAASAPLIQPGCPGRMPDLWEARRCPEPPSPSVTASPRVGRPRGLRGGGALRAAQAVMESSQLAGALRQLQFPLCARL